MDVKNAFLQGEIEEQVYMVQAPRISLRSKHLGSVATEEVPLRTKANPACLECKVHAATASNGVCNIKIGLFTVRLVGQHELVSILLYVDDLVIADADLGETGRAKSHLAASFNMKDLGDLHYFLGI